MSYLNFAKTIEQEHKRIEVSTQFQWYNGY